MALSAAEQAELDSLNAEHSAPAPSASLTPAEQAELDALNAEHSGQAAPEGESWTDKALHGGKLALQLMAKGYKGRDMLVAGNPVARAAWLAYHTTHPDPNAKDKLVDFKDVKDYFTTMEGGLDAGTILKRAGVEPEKAENAGLAFDILAPGDPTGAIIGKGISKSSDLFRAAGLRNLLARVPWRQRAAAFKVFKEEAIAGGLKNQANMAGKAVDAADHAVNSSIARATGDGLSADSQAFLGEANSYLDEFGKTAAPGDAGSAAHYAKNVADEAARARPAPVSLEFLNRQRKAIGPTGNKAEQAVRKMLRDRLVKDAGQVEGQAIDKGLARESLLIMGRNGAESAANRAWGARGLAIPALGATLGAGRNLHLGDDFSFGGLAKGALGGALAAKAVTSPWALTRGAQAFEAASPYLGRLAAQGIYRQLPQKEDDHEDEKDPWAGEIGPDPWSGNAR